LVQIDPNHADGRNELARAKKVRKDYLEGEAKKVRKDYLEASLRSSPSSSPDPLNFP